MRRPFLTAEWRHLAMLNYEADPTALRPLVPAGTELDEWNGKAFLSVVGFLFLQTRLFGAPVPFHRNFEEVNLRFYVRRKADDGCRRGVVFVKEFVPRLAVALVARWIYHENYQPSRTGSAIRAPTQDDGRGRVEYTWRVGPSRNLLRVEFAGEAGLPSAGSEEEFIAEHYWGYTRRRDGATSEYAVEHPPWRVWMATAARLECDVERCYGRQFRPFLERPPSSAFVAEGSPVAVYPGCRIPSEGLP